MWSDLLFWFAASYFIVWFKKQLKDFSPGKAD